MYFCLQNIYRHLQIYWENPGYKFKGSLSIRWMVTRFECNKDLLFYILLIPFSSADGEYALEVSNSQPRLDA